MSVFLNLSVKLDIKVIYIDRVGFLPGKKVFLPFPWEEMGFYQEENISSEIWKKLPIARVTW